MRKRSLSVACERATDLEKISNKFEGVPSENADESDTEEEESDEVQGSPGSEWNASDYKTLIDKLRSALPRNDKKSYKHSLKIIDWENVAFDHHTPDEVKTVTTKLISKIRKLRSLSEMIEDIPMQVRKYIAFGKPKKPLSVYNFYVKDRFSYLKNKHPELPSGAVMKLMKEEYNVLSDKKKQKYEAMAAESKEVYAQQLEQYYQDNPNELPKKVPRKVKAKIKTISPFNLFKEDKQTENKDLTIADIRDQWSQLAVKQKLKYIQKAFKSKQTDTANPVKISKEEQLLIEHAKGKPVPIPRSTSDYYIKKYADGMPIEGSLLLWRKQKSIEYKALPKLRKLELEIEYRQAKQAYVTEYENYIASITDEKAQQAEIDLLKSFIEKKMDKDDRQQLPDDSQTFSATIENEMSDLPIAESTILPSKKKKAKDAAPQNGPISTGSSKEKPLKSILKSPTKSATVTKPDTQTFVEPAVPSKKKRKQSLSENDSDSTSEKKSKRSIVRVPIVEPPNLKKKRSKENGNVATTADDSSQEPVRPPSTIIEYYQQFHYLGKPENCEESFNKLSANRKEKYVAEMRAAQKKYFKDLQKFLKHVEPQNIKKYIKKLKKAKDAFDLANESLQLSESTMQLVAKATPKQEPVTSSSSESSGEDIGESSEEEKNQNNQNGVTDDDESSDNE